jgi:hypothetical protein
MSNEAMKRWTAAPTKFDKADFGTTCTVLLNDSGSETELYVQISEDSDDMQWLSARDLLLAVYEDNLNDASFLQDLLDLYRALDTD